MYGYGYTVVQMFTILPSKPCPLLSLVRSYFRAYVTLHMESWLLLIGIEYTDRDL